jgi:hypothetical protein
MEGNLYGTDSLDIDDILEYWTVTPVNRTTQVHSLYMMYGLTETLTLEGRVRFTQNQTENWTPTTTYGVYFAYETESYGVDNVEASVLWSVFSEGPYRAHVHAGMSFPFFGGIDDYDDNPYSGGSLDYSPYPMQIGTGTFDFLPGFTLQVQNSYGSFGMQGKGTIHLGRNDHDWSLGNRYMGTFWGAYRFSDYISASGRIEAATWGELDGYDSRLDALFSPEANPSSLGGTRVDLPLGVNLVFPEGRMAGYRLSVEGVKPLYQDLDGPQLQHSWSVRFGISKIF